MDSTLDRTFRESCRTIIASLTRAFGPRNLDLVETVVQDAFVKAAETWATHGGPENPGGWLLAVAKNRLLDQLRHDGAFERKRPELTHLAAEAEVVVVAEPALRTEVTDDELAMMFVACHPELPIESQLALSLRTLCGMAIADLAKALLAPP